MPSVSDDAKIAAAQEQVDEVICIMHDNIKKTIDRGERIEVLHGKSEDLLSHAQVFYKRAKDLRNAMWWKNTKTRICVGCVCISVFLLVLSLVIWGINR